MSKVTMQEEHSKATHTAKVRDGLRGGFDIETGGYIAPDMLLLVGETINIYPRGKDSLYSWTSETCDRWRFWCEEWLEDITPIQYEMDDEED